MSDEDEDDSDDAGDEKTAHMLELEDGRGAIGFTLDDDGNCTIFFEHECDEFDGCVTVSTDGTAKQIQITALSESETLWLIERIAEERKERRRR